MPPILSIEPRFPERLRALGLNGEGVRVMVAVSGGLDSVALLHLMRFAAGEPGMDVVAAHCDHAMRAHSGEDARWVAGLCRAWGVPLWTRRAHAELRGEAEARAWRYGALREMMREAGATHLATAHHADDQAETVLFRVLRGAGIDGLAGIAERAAGGLVRPLLPYWRAEVRDHVRRAGLRWREDPTNRTAAYARNRIRRLLPVLERDAAPGARRSLARLAEVARAEGAAWNAVLAPLEGEAARWEDGALLVVRSALAGYDSALAARLLRRLLAPFGGAPGLRGTRAALQFITAAPSGRTLQLPGGVRIRTEFGVARIERAGGGQGGAGQDTPVRVASERGEGTAAVGGAELRVRWWTAEWGAEAAEAGSATVALLAEGLRTPLLVRGWRPGDRLGTAGGTRKLKKLLGERRVPRGARARLPVLADADGRALWASAVGQDPSTLPRPGAAALLISIGDG
ncbi:MAG: tilS [Gemmatimonadetes bacterium]|nr:tilS [Gemmatimonadota bacterium]